MKLWAKRHLKSGFQCRVPTENYTISKKPSSWEIDAAKCLLHKQLLKLALEADAAQDGMLGYAENPHEMRPMQNIAKGGLQLPAVASLDGIKYVEDPTNERGLLARVDIENVKRSFLLRTVFPKLSKGKSENKAVTMPFYWVGSTPDENVANMTMKLKDFSTDEVKFKIPFAVNSVALKAGVKLAFLKPEKKVIGVLPVYEESEAEELEKPPKQPRRS